MKWMVLSNNLGFQGMAMTKEMIFFCLKRFTKPHYFRSSLKIVDGILSSANNFLHKDDLKFYGLNYKPFSDFYSAVLCFIFEDS